MTVVGAPRSIRDDLLDVQREIRKLRMAGFRNPLGAANTAVDLLDRLVTLMDAYFGLVAVASQQTAAALELLEAGAAEHWGESWAAGENDAQAGGS